MRKRYAYFVTVNSKKRIGGTISADSMDDAVRQLAKRDGLTIERADPVFRPCDGAMIPQAKWLFEGKRASVAIWAPPEYFY